MESDLSEQRTKTIRDNKIRDEQHQQYKRDQSAYLSQYIHYLAAIEDMFWEQCDRLARLIGNEIEYCSRRKKAFFIIPLSSIEDGKLKVRYKDALDGHFIYITVEIIAEKEAQQGACIRFHGSLYSPQNHVGEGGHLFKDKIEGKYELSGFDIAKASLWLDNLFGDFYQFLKRNFSRWLQ